MKLYSTTLSAQASPPVLLTSSVVAMDKTVNLKSQELRIHHTLESVGHWLRIDPHFTLVICDGSGFDFSSAVQAKFPEASVECLYFMNNEALVEYHGKGFGEGEIVKHALNHSRYLNASAVFAKCTAKLWVENFAECLQEWNGSFLAKGYFKNVFSLKPTKLDYIDTRFYVATHDFYREHFLDTHKNVGGPNGKSIEDEFLAVILKKGIKHCLFKQSPAIYGVSGAHGTYYKNNAIRAFKERLRTSLVRLYPSFRPLFNNV